MCPIYDPWCGWFGFWAFFVGLPILVMGGMAVMYNMDTILANFHEWQMHSSERRLQRSQARLLDALSQRIRQDAWQSQLDRQTALLAMQALQAGTPLDGPVPAQLMEPQLMPTRGMPSHWQVVEPVPVQRNQARPATFDQYIQRLLDSGDRAIEKWGR